MEDGGKWSKNKKGWSVFQIILSIVAIGRRPESNNFMLSEYQNSNRKQYGGSDDNGLEDMFKDIAFSLPFLRCCPSSLSFLISPCHVWTPAAQHK